MNEGLLRLSAATGICYEHAFTSSHSTIDDSTATFTYQYPEHWLSYPSNSKAVAVRSVNVTPAARRLSLHGIYLRSEKLTLKLNIDVTLGANEDMSHLNDRLQRKLMSIYQQYKDEVTNARISNPSATIDFMPDDIAMYYDDSDSTFNLVASDGFYLQVTSPSVSEDFNELMAIPSTFFTNIAKVQALEMSINAFNAYLKSEGIDAAVQFYDGTYLKVKAITFKNIWNRSQLIVTSSLSTLAERKYLTLSNVQYDTPKIYTVNGYSKSFSISLYDSIMKRPVRLPPKDLIVVEMILIAQ